MLVLTIVFLILSFPVLKIRPFSFAGVFLILIGGITNLLERYFHRCVMDNIYLGLLHVNFSDVLISIGLLIVVFVFIISNGGKNGSAKKDTPNN